MEVRVSESRGGMVVVVVVVESSCLGGIVFLCGSVELNDCGEGL